MRIPGILPAPWYNKYTSFYNEPADKQLIDQIKENFRRLNYDSPLATVVIIAHNEEKTLMPCLYSLSESVCGFPVEVIGIDNNSTDRTAEIFASVGIHWYRETKKGPGHARQCGLNHARGKYYLSADADVIYPKHYIQGIVKYLERGHAVVSAHYGYFANGDNSPVVLKMYELVKDMHIFLYSIRRPELAVRGAVMGFYTDSARRIGYKTDIKCGEDGSMALGLKKYGEIKITLSRKTRVVTGTRSLTREGSLYRHFLRAVKKHAKKPKAYFTKQNDYPDREDNKII